MRSVCLLFCFAFFGSLFAQNRLTVTRVSNLPAAAGLLSGSSRGLENDKLRLESILDLVAVSTADSVIQKKTQRHVAAWGWALQRAFGLKWELLDRLKQKYVGTASRPTVVFDGVAREVDMNIFIMPHLPKYVAMVRAIYQETILQNHGSTNQFRTDNPPFPSPEELRAFDGQYYTVECEVTPDETAREEFSNRVFPVKPGELDLLNHPNFGTAYPSFGTYGPLCLDCNHNCRPEIHPMDWLWWTTMDAASGKWVWYAALMHDDTRRFDDWSAAPLEGKISIPFFIPAGRQSCDILVEVMVAQGVSKPILYPAKQAALQPLHSETYELGQSGSAVQLRTGSVTAGVLCQVNGVQESEVSGDKLGYVDLVARASGMLVLRVTTETK